MRQTLHFSHILYADFKNATFEIPYQSFPILMTYATYMWKGGSEFEHEFSKQKSGLQCMFELVNHISSKATSEVMLLPTLASSLISTEMDVVMGAVDVD